MHAWVPFALVRITFFYVIGTLICIYNLVIFSHSSIFFITLGVAICYTLLWVLIRRNSLRRFNIVLSLTGFLTILCLGYLNVKWSNQSEKENHIIHSKKIEILNYWYACECCQTDCLTKTWNAIIVNQSCMSIERNFNSQGNYSAFIWKAPTLKTP